MDRTSALDSAFLHVETEVTALHIASLAFFEGPVPSHEEVRAAIGRKLPLAPRCRQRLVGVPMALGRPVWVDDPEFDIDRHIHRLAVPAPGGDRQVREIASHLLSEPLDHAIPLWEDWILEGLAGGRWALLTKVHHTMADGIAGTDLLSTLLDTTPEGDPVPPDHWQPGRLPPRRKLVSGALRDIVALRVDELRSLPQTAGTALGGGLRHPRAAAESVYAAARGLLGYLGNARPTADSSLVGSVGRTRGYGWTEVDLGTVLQIHGKFGGTVNDLVLAVVAGAFRDLLLARGEQPAPHTVRSLVPVSVRRPQQRGRLDNRVSAILADLPVEIADPHDRLTEMAIRMRALKESHEAQVGEQLTAIADALPPLPLAAFLHAAFRVPHRHLTTVVTNVPGPTERLYLAGRPMTSTCPYVPIGDRLRSGVAVTTYDGRLLFGVTTDVDSMPDAQVLVDGIATGFADLAARAGLHARPGRTRTKVAR